MIESKKKYDETLDFLKINRFAYDEANEIDDLIEALREVARAADEMNEADQMDEGVIFFEKVLPALDALPDWITENG